MENVMHNHMKYGCAILALLAGLYASQAQSETETPDSEVTVENAEAVETVEEAPPIPESAPLPQAVPLSSFERMLMHVYETHPKLIAGRAELKAADEQVSQANAGFRPSINANAATGGMRVKTNDSGWQSGEEHTASLVAVQPIFSGFGTMELKRAAEARVMAARAKLLGTEQLILLTAAASWVEVCEKEKIMRLVQDNLHRMYQYSRATKERFEGGDGTQTDVAQAESRLAQAEARHASAQAEREVAWASYERDVGLKPESTEMPSLPHNLPTSREEAEQSAKNNPAMAQIAYEEVAAGHDVETLKSSVWPSVYLRGSMSEERLPGLGIDRQREDSLTLNISLPLYQGGGEYSRVREAKREREKVKEEVRNIEWEVLQRARQAWSNYMASKTIINASQKATEASQRALDGVEEEHKQGLRTLTEVLDEQAELLDSQITETQAQKSLRLEAFRLLAATGRLTAEGLDLPLEPYDPDQYHDWARSRWFGF